MITVEEHLAAVLEGLHSLEQESVPTSEALGRVLAADLHARYQVPPFTNSAMDGFAVRAADVSAGVVLPVVGDIPAGPGTPAPLPVGSAQRIMTGAPLPEGADAVVPVEDTDQPRGAAPLPSHVRIGTVPRVGQHVRVAGEDVRAGDVVLTAGSRLTPSRISAAVSVGHGVVPVIRTPRVAVISTGTELRGAGEELGPGEIPDSNGPLLVNLVREAGGVATHTRSGDDPREFEAALQAAREADLVVTSGGVSAGAFDVVKHVLAARGLTFSAVAMQPGKPQGHGWLEAGPRRVPIFTLPGNPVSVFVSFHLFVAPALQRLQGATSVPHQVAATARTGWTGPAHRRQYIPVQVDFAGAVSCAPVHLLGSGSHLVASLGHANGIAIVPEDVVQVNAGDPVTVRLIGRVQ